MPVEGWELPRAWAARERPVAEPNRQPNDRTEPRSHTPSHKCRTASRYPSQSPIPGALHYVSARLAWALRVSCTGLPCP